MQQVRFALFVLAGDQMLTESQLSAQFNGRGFLRQEGVWPAFDQKTFAVFRQNHAAQPVGGLEQFNGAVQALSGREFFDEVCGGDTECFSSRGVYRP